MKLDDETRQTRWTLVARIKDPGDKESWHEFYETYKRLILQVATKSGLRPDEAEDALQATMASVSKNIGAFEADRANGSFTAWLLKLARWRILDQFRKRLPDASLSHDAGDDSPQTPTIERIPDPREMDVARACDAELQRWQMDQALEKLPNEVRAEHYQIFHLLAVEQKPIADVARMLGKSRAQVYLVKHRVTRVLQRLVSQLDKD